MVVGNKHLVLHVNKWCLNICLITGMILGSFDW